ncbi:tRNA adenosine(34) deaminase TadA [Acidaminobacter hydrogenoformans]|uniref:tRNA-specific adenosine deaminase n=1 Tax=Acidaminobacter hydrogenoformans DSM 2784 TaxID=1120920 RepID=A0A1G5RRI2_9FIRM|nr:tRNA adenosine(34) deaminase TadA [Acidaminobacter hydrogenoformans]SCZ76654.1 tRNA-adenosine deaminase [Acidaminobacter hydrogenoformans DSM 2784]
MLHDEMYMREALYEARLASSKGEVPIGAVIVRRGVIIARGHNLKEQGRNAQLHAEMIALEKASKHLNSWRLTGCTLYVTIEPCLMCAGAIYQSRVSRVVYGSKDIKAGAFGSLYDLSQDKRINHRVQLEKGILSDETAQIMSSFFEKLRVK